MRREWWWLLALVVIGAGIGLRDPWPPDEPRFVLVVRDMVADGNWLFPHVAGVLYPDKPPLYFWLMAAFWRLTGGIQRIAFLLPSLAAGLATLSLVNDLGRRLWNPRAGFAAAAALLLTVQFTLQARSAQIDMLLCFWVTLGMYGLTRHLLLGPDWRWYVLAWIAMGAGIMTKGVGFLPMLVLVPYAFVRARGWSGIPSIAAGWRWWAGPLAMVGTLALWLVPMLVVVAQSGDPALARYRDEILFTQTVVRYTAAWHHHRPIWHFLEVIAVLWLPLIAALPWLLPAWRRRLARQDARFALLLGWVVLVFAFFTASTGKRDVYILPALPMFALAAGPLLPALVRLQDVRRLAYLLTGVFPLIIGALLVWYQVIDPAAGAELVERYGIAPWAPATALAAAAAVWLALGPGRGVHALAGAIVSVWLVYGWYVMPTFNPVRTPIAVLERADAVIGQDAELALVDWKEQFVLFAPRPVHHFGFRRDPDAELSDALAWLAAEPDRRWLLLPAAAFDRAAGAHIDRTRAIKLGHAHREDWYLLSAPPTMTR